MLKVSLTRVSLKMNKPPYGPPPAAPPSYAEAVGGVPPSSPFTTGKPIVPLGSQPTHMICPFCHAEVDTTTKSKPGVIAYVSGIVIALLGCWLGCCLIPCCIDECMDVHHSCPNCDAYLGRSQQ
ncbi:hypothetical protein J437_LFUL012675 [Ladona fulva]|uniref:LITAF domain-containing protein n=1 Tax=Ladona fulva TaxID=123851 RepID=A0A8K0P6D0_LADFU|nr:hypothetical protein J437_LFUL012675 [Ladona fulva]